ncbi:hypothetical protein EDB85DRAFT_1897297 [Lactarius pseudohatsudake]|nr:hypothetical protein EDB85DRAFT_1902558 [Lactarius pseudohatsudake]KAH9018138.1 hypothetical protein EDB85DRAFT_1897297 [Lactarius pseudohatsudake]
MPSPAPQGGGLRPRNLGKDQLNLFKAVSRDEGAGRNFAERRVSDEEPGLQRWRLYSRDLGARSAHARRRLPHTRTSNTELQTAKMFLHIAHSLLKLAWKWIKKGVVIPLNNQMRKKGWRVEFTFTVRLNIATRSGDIFDRSLPLRLALPRGVVAAPGEGAEQV